LRTVDKLRAEGIGSIDFRQWDVHPPTYYYALYGWSFLNPGGVSRYHWAQEFSVVCLLAFLVFAYLALRKAFGRYGEYATVLLALCTTYLHYGTEVRMYALIFMFSAMLLYAVVNRLAGWRFWMALVVVFLLPLTHYFASMAVFFFTIMGIVLSRKQGRWRSLKWKYAIFFIMGIIGIVVAALFFALPQRSRVQGTWFWAPSPLDWPDSVFYGFFMTEGSSPKLVFSIAYLALMCVIIYMFYKVYKIVGKRNVSEDEVFRVLLGMGVIFPMLGLVGAPLLGGEGFAHLYHHRFFLMVMWMFAVLLFVSFFELLERLRIWVAMVLLGLVLWVLLLNIVIYGQSAHHELQNLIEMTPCPVGGGQPIQIAHESPFSSLQYDLYAEDNGCRWVNFVSTNMSSRNLAGGGGDAMVPGLIFYNRTLPDGDYYYVYAAGTVPIDGVREKVALEDGVELWKVTRIPHLGRDIRRMWYDNSTELQYMRVEWS
jgi:hypothetical protein